ncbi:MAG TPA: ribbon-helix-helix protein, CopG family [Pyrinomonadaceae bacterium]|nr:ribbon-helix-helix protein, CopG family [Pyrinomonadaceae bacterium]
MGVQIEVDEAIMPQIDRLAKNSHRSRADLVNEILRKGLRRESTEDKVRRFQESYQKLPQTPHEVGELSEWEDIQDWGDQ